MRGLRPRLLGPRIYSPAEHWLPGPAHAGAALLMRGLRPRLLGPRIYCSTGHFYQGLLMRGLRPRLLGPRIYSSIGRYGGDDERRPSDGAGN